MFLLQFKVTFGINDQTAYDECNELDDPDEPDDGEELLPNELEPDDELLG